MTLIPWASIAKIEVDGEHSGTGFLVTPQYVLTARHVVADNTGRPFRRIVLRFNAHAEFLDGSQVFESGAAIEQKFSSGEHDFALLKCSNPPPYTPLSLSDRPLHLSDFCASPGFARANPDGFTLAGQISSPNDQLPRGAVAIGVQFDVGSNFPMKGHSGAPLLVNSRVVGLLRTAFLDGQELTMGGIVHATSIRRVVEFCNQVAPGLLAFHAPVEWPRDVTVPPPVCADRKKEFEIFEQMITGQSLQRVLLLSAEAGSGKSFLADELSAYAERLGLRIARINCKYTPTLEEVFNSLLLDVHALLPAAVRAAGFARFIEIVEDLTALDRPLLLVLDTYEHTGEAVRKWVIGTLLASMSRMPGLVILIAGQHNLPDPDHPASKTWRDLAALRRLGPISSAQDWFDYVRSKWPSANIVKEQVEEITLLACGRPDAMDGNLRLLREGPPGLAPGGNS